MMGDSLNSKFNFSIVCANEYKINNMKCILIVLIDIFLPTGVSDYPAEKKQLLINQKNCER